MPDCGSCRYRSPKRASPPSSGHRRMRLGVRLRSCRPTLPSPGISWDRTPVWVTLRKHLCRSRHDRRIRTRRVLAAGVLISGALFPCACNRARPQDDKTITREIQARLYQDTTLKKRDISIIAQKGVVVLSGQVNSEEEKASAEHLAAGAGGVKQVINQLAVVRPCPAATPPAQQAAGPEPSKGVGANH